MTPKEAFEILVKNISISTDDETWKLLTEDSKYPLKQLEEYKLVTQALTELEELKRYPTSKEVIVTWLNYFKSKIIFYDEISKTFKEIHLSRNDEIISYYADKTITINANYGLPPHLITLIGRFYEGLEKVGKAE